MPKTTFKYRDGVSKFNRQPGALDPKQLQIDDRSVADWLAFAQEYAGELVFFNSNHQAEGNWTPLLYPNRQSFENAVFAEKNQTGNPEWWPSNWRKTIENYLEDPNGFNLSEKQLDLISRPHFSLFLVFLKLLQQVQEQVNSIPQRHLDFYFQEFLQLLRKPAQPDQVHLVFELAKGTEQVLIPRGTTIETEGAPNTLTHLYKTDREALFNKAKVKTIFTLFADKEGPVYISQPAAVADKSTAQVQSWKTLGQKPELGEDASHALGRIGLLIASPLLYLEGGSRYISLEVSFSSEITFLTGQFTADTFQFSVSTSEGMKLVELDQIDITLDEGDAKKLNVSLRIPANFPPLQTISAAEAEQYHLPITGPCLAITLTPSSYTLYPLLRNLAIESVDVKVDVGGLEAGDLNQGPGLPNLLLQNDERVIDAKKPFTPFTNQPKKGSGFYLSHPEIASKQLSRLWMKFNWASLPEAENQEDYYANYWAVKGFQSPPPGFMQAEISMVERGITSHLENQAPIFNTPFEFSSELQANNPFALPQPLEEALQANRYFAIRLKSALGHDEYPVLLNKQIREGMKDNPKSWWDLVLPPPYIPELLSVEVKYSSIAHYSKDETSSIQLFHLHPFGYRKAETEHDASFLPVYGNTVTSSDSGALYLGIQDLTPPQTLSLLFQLVEGSTNPDSPIQPVQLSHLQNDQWIDLRERGCLINDDTNNFTRSGIIELRISDEATRENSLLPNGLHWIKIELNASPDSVCNTLGIHAQAVKGTFDSPSFPDTVEKIQKWKAPLSGISAVVQPYTSFGGRLIEDNKGFYVRVSERLRHKQRAISSWDYERLVLERFPEIYKVKCLPASLPGEVGRVRLIVLPDLRTRRPTNLFEPQVSAKKLDEIQKFLGEFTPPNAKVEVINASFDRIQVEGSIYLKPNYIEKDYYLQQINLELQQFLSPWAFDPNTDIVIGGRLYVSLIINFIEELEYVDYVDDLFLKKVNSSPVESISIFSTKSYLEASSEKHVLVSHHPHDIRVYVPGVGPGRPSGIGRMRIEYDFIVGPES